MNFITLFIIFSMSFLIGLSGAMMPGPVTTMTISETLKYENPKRGWLIGVMIATGHALLEILLMIGLWLGISYFLSSPTIIMVISLVGGGALVVFGIIGLRALKKSAKELSRTFNNIEAISTAGVSNKKSELSSLKRAIFLGFTLSATSSGWWLWWATIGMNAISLASDEIYIFSNLVIFVTFYLGHVSSDFTWFSFISIVTNAGKKKINVKTYQFLLTATNIFLLGMGIYFIMSSFT
ncbi:MAG: LysE family translocator [Promethearchaeota archaeon]